MSIGKFINLVQIFTLLASSKINNKPSFSGRKKWFERPTAFSSSVIATFTQKVTKWESVLPLKISSVSVLEGLVDEIDNVPSRRTSLRGKNIVFKSIKQGQIYNPEILEESPILPKHHGLHKHMSSWLNLKTLGISIHKVWQDRNNILFLLLDYSQ